MDVPVGNSKESKKNDAGFNVSLKQQKNRRARNNSYDALFLRLTGQETRNQHKKH
jgi:hypothetical protein